MNPKNIILVAGGTGGHINAAIALGNHYQEQGFNIYYFSGRRYLDYQLYKGMNVIHLNVLGLRYNNPFKILKSIFYNIFSFIKMFFVILKIRPIFAIGAGGYVCGPVLLACKILRTPSFILEQNSIMGLTNKLLAPFMNKIFLHFKETKGLSEKLRNKSVVVGNPIRFNFIQKDKNESSNNILVFGGSLGASQINEALELSLNKIADSSVSIIHQIGRSGKRISIKSDIKYQAYEYLDDMNHFYNWADRIICRAGASTISELKLVSKPCLIIPYPKATDDHQTINATLLKSEVDFSVSIADKKLNNEELSQEIISFIESKSVHSGTSIEDVSLKQIDQELSYLF